MMKQVIGALLAAAALVPAAASAQRRGATDDGQRPFEQVRGGDDQPDPDRQARREARQQQRAERMAQPEQRAEQPQFQTQTPRQAGAEGGWQGRRDGLGDGQVRGQIDAGQVGQVQDRSDRRRDWQRREDVGQPVDPRADIYRDRAPDRGGALDGSRLDDRSRLDGRSRIDTRTRIDPRSRFDDPAGFGDRGRFEDRNSYDRRTPGRGYDNRGYQDRSTFDQGYNNNGRWSRDWRGDNRYDWNRYRSSNRNAFRLPRYYSPGGWDGGYRRFSIGASLSSVLWSRNYWIDDPYAYRLPEAYGPYRWVRYYNDAILVDLRSGYVVDTVYGIFY